MFLLYVQFVRCTTWQVWLGGGRLMEGLGGGGGGVAGGLFYDLSDSDTESLKVLKGQ